MFQLLVCVVLINLIILFLPLNFSTLESVRISLLTTSMRSVARETGL